MNRYPNFTSARQVLEASFRHSDRVHTERWQGIDVTKKPEAEMHELLFVSFQTPMIDDLGELRRDIKPNLPWADDHFLERVGGEPLNPGETWKGWPWANSAQNFIDNGGGFSHTYMERYWPRYAAKTDGGRLGNDLLKIQPFLGHYGHRFRYGDLRDVVTLLAREPLTRQAYLPIFFPEDTGDAHQERKPCTLGYHFIVRDGKLHIVYYIRSCDFVRHYADDVYLTVRLALWMIEECRKYHETPETSLPSKAGRTWFDIRPGYFVMHITSLHMFRNDHIKLFGRT